MQTENLTALEALGIAIRSEIDAQEVYSDLVDMCGDELLKNRFLSLFHEERRHQTLLEAKYKEMFPETDLALPQSQLPAEVVKSNNRKKMQIKDVLRLAINEEKRAREFYLDCAVTAKDLSGNRMFRFLADMEFSHQMILVAELELIEKYPSYMEGPKKWEAETRLKADKIKSFD
jgi:rubrerythrin